MKGLCVCNLPNLESFMFSGDAKLADPCEVKVCDSLVPRVGVIVGEKFLAGCPNVQKVYMNCATFMDDKNCIPHF